MPSKAVFQFYEYTVIFFVRPAGRTLDRTRFAPSNSTVVYYRNGRKCFKGSSSLKSAQTYPATFGREVPWHTIDVTHD